MHRKFLPFLVLLAVAAGAHAQDRHNSDYYFDRADRSLRELLSTVEAYHLPGCVEGMKTRRWEAALGDCQFILNYFPNHPTGLLALADICQAWKSPKCNPDPYFEKAIIVNPKVSGAYVTQGIYLMRASRAKDAVPLLEQAAALEPNSVNAHYNLGLAYFETRQYEAANESAQRAYALGAPVPGLRDKLKKAGYWKPGASPNPAASEGAPQGANAAPPKN